MQITPFGKLVRSYRIQVETRTKEMADALGLTVSYLSAVETGKKNINNSFVEAVAKFFGDRGLSVKAELEEAAAKSKKNVEVDGLCPESRALVNAFARRLPEMSEAKKAEFKRFLDELE